MHRFIRLAVTGAAAGIAALGVAMPAAAEATPGHTHAVGTYSGHPARSGGGGARTRNMTYHGGPIEQVPAVYISWWGPEWTTGFSTGGYTSAQLQTYMTDFYSNAGG